MIDNQEAKLECRYEIFDNHICNVNVKIVFISIFRLRIIIQK